MKIELDDMLKLHAVQSSILDPEKCCENCTHNTDDNKECNDCFNSMIGIPVNPTNFEKNGGSDG